ncbi:MAG: Uma2 family endonuclease [Leptolyngbya sp. Prado105]|nr:Uma2 family endonuclease [Leptolyngbya sp. Prado105]
MPEYWIADPKNRTVTVLELQDGAYVTFGIFANDDCSLSPTFPNLEFTAAQIFSEE